MWAEVWRAERLRREWNAPNKANLPGAGETGGAGPTLRQDVVRDARPTKSELCETKPIGTRAEESVGQAPPYKRAQLGQTKPIRPGRAADRGAWEEACETKPIPPGRHKGQVLYGKRVRANWARSQAQQNKANLPP